MDSRFWRVKWPLTEGRLRRMKAALDNTGEDDWFTALGAMDDDGLCEFLSALTGRSLRAVKRRLSVCGALCALLDFGHRTGEVKRMYEEIHGRQN